MGFNSGFKGLMLCSDKLLAKYSKLFIHPAANINNSLVIDIFLYSFT